MSFFPFIYEQDCSLTKGAAGPSKLDAEQFKIMLVSNKFRKEGQDLRENIAIMVKKLATQTCSRSITNSNWPRVWYRSCNHAMKEIFDDAEYEAVILIDATNAFNTLNRKVSLHNIQYICPPFSKILINTYRNSSIV